MDRFESRCEDDLRYEWLSGGLLVSQESLAPVSAACVKMAVHIPLFMVKQKALPEKI